MNKDKVDKTVAFYATLMEELKERSILIGTLLENRLNIPPVPCFELCQVQMRMICEILSVACLAAHDDIADVKSSMMQTEYNAEKVFKRLTRLHPSFYPIPHDKEDRGISPATGTRNLHLTPRTDGFLTKDELVKSYNECGNFLHRGSIKRLTSKWYPDINFERIRDWNVRMGNLLAPYHYIGLSGGNQYILCVMHDVNNGGKVQCAFAESIQSTTSRS